MVGVGEDFDGFADVFAGGGDVGVGLGGEEEEEERNY